MKPGQTTLTGLINMTMDERNQPSVNPSRSCIRERARQYMKVPNITIVEVPGRVAEAVWFREIALERRRNIVRITIVVLSTMPLFLRKRVPEVKVFRHVDLFEDVEQTLFFRGFLYLVVGADGYYVGAFAMI